MMGSVMDGEDVVQEALFEAHRMLDKFDESRPLKPWLFRIAHNRCIDFLRRKGVRDEAEAAAAMPEAVSPDEPTTLGIDKAVEHLVASLPPKERACVLLKDVFDYSLAESAELIDSTVSAVKAALNRGRTKLAAASPPAPAKSARSPSLELGRILQLYVDRFNRRDWDGVRELISADARLNVADAFAGNVVDSPYFAKYEQWPTPWKLTVGEVDGEPVVIILERGADTWTPYSAVRLEVVGQRIERIVDYRRCPWVIPAAASVSLPVPTTGADES
jgi:RNA polymerase sigma-70 factor (ECF subfamily)